MIQFHQFTKRALSSIAILFLLLIPQQLFASCEGTTDTVLFGAWLNESDGTLIKEVGYDYETESAAGNLL